MPITDEQFFARDHYFIAYCQLSKKRTLAKCINVLSQSFYSQASFWHEPHLLHESLHDKTDLVATTLEPCDKVNFIVNVGTLVVVLISTT